MERLWVSETPLLGPSPVDAFSSPGEGPVASRRMSDLDFNDVFGGPPRSSPARHGAEESWDVSGRRRGLSEGGREDGAGLSWARPLSSIGERPVFGEISSPSPRRKDLGEEFFSDIFKGGDSVCSSPKRLDQVDAFPSTPASRVLSPARSLPPRRETFTGSPLLTSQSSLSRRLAKELEFPSPLSSGLNTTRNESILSGPEVEVYNCGTKQGTPSKDRQKPNPHITLRQSFSSCRFSHEDRSMEIMDPTVNIQGHPVKEDSTGSKLDGKTGQFHFSIYKWASKSVMLVVPSSKDKSKYNSRVSGIPVPFIQGVNLCANDKDLPVAFPRDIKKLDNTSFDEFATQSRDNNNSVKALEEVLPHKLESAAHSGVVPAEPGKEYIQLAEEKEDFSSPATSAVDVPSDIKPQLSRHAVTDRFEGQDPPAALEEKMQSGRVKGKVKEFIKFFNQELSCKPIAIVESQGRSPKVKAVGTNKIEENGTTWATRMDEEDMICTSSVGAPTGGPMVMKRVPKETELYSNISSNAVETSESPQEKNEELAHFESAMENFEVAYIDVDEPHYEVEECMVEDIIQEQLPPTELSSEKIQKLDAKIKEWSAGKEGNIRSLLSTLQYVLWSGSGWKPVPLVNIIEGGSVKRAYQRAMLCLHPDKLQQRGSPLNEKYIAEKVFDVLQEAWDHFNSISAM